MTAVDVSATVLRRAAAYAAEAEVFDRIDRQEHGLSRTFPEGVFDLVSAQFLHSPVPAGGEYEAVLACAAVAVSPGGVLLVVGHAGWPSWTGEPPFDFRFPTNPGILAALAPEPGRWGVETDEVVTRDATGRTAGPATAPTPSCGSAG